MQNYETDVSAFAARLADVIEDGGTADNLIAATEHVLPFSAAFCVVNRPSGAPVYLADNYPDGAARKAVQLYVRSTYLLNPVYNAILNGLPEGLYPMADLAPDNWAAELASDHVLPAQDEEIGYRTEGWPRGLQELSLLVDLGQGDMGEISFARPAADGGFTPCILDMLRPFLPLIAVAFRRIWSGQDATPTPKPAPALDEFAQDVLTTRESEIIHMILKGHSSLSVSMALGIALPTVKSHRRNAYSKLGVSTQQQLFTAFLKWQGGSV
ncbi:helix-turn-helix transcriptional regulator [Halocynthiibacter styelae]|uniref:LuxR family transcriptional regulator n=1 Tax=Halocynthiibacter styelae TaxID=2761955 RepID=A0A8J7IDK2_9RHOB|nr:helix-turn-helix transcriptional regulator [Paenihalocynthiibacter styelae]MBI1492732.1 LuxR family transcriptional regulator [Paenihalocynthiibacter styelae]